jgi:glycosyltransferase involved in cell wall biosynthesis
LKAHYRRSLPPVFRPVFDAYVTLFLALYRRALSHIDRVIANSENVRSRLATHFDISATVVHPPVAIDRFRWLANGDEYVSLARLEPLKRVDKVIQAFQRMPDRRLVVASGGSEEARLRQLAEGYANIRFTGWLSEPALADLVGRMRAAIYVPVNEDFGMSPVEAMAAGKPVIGVAEGGLLETVLPNETGVLIDDELTPESICDAVTRLDRLGPASMRDACEARAALFSEEVFVAKMRDVVGLHEPTRGRPLQ